jgi:acyl carrier protein
MPPLTGVLHAAMVIDDRLIANLDAVSMAAVLQPKLVGAWNLHNLTLDIPLEHFVMYSSITTSIGNPGQGNYVAANAGLEGLAEFRRQMGLPAVTIGWGPIGDTGYLTRNSAVMDSLEQRLGKAPLAAAEALAELGSVLARNERVVSLANFDWNTLSRLLPSSSSARFAVLNRNLKDKGQIEDSIDFKAQITGKSVEEVAGLVSNLVIQEIAQTLCIGADRVDVNRSLHDLGMDSLMAVELALGLEQRFGIQLPAMMLNDSPSAARVTARIVERLLGAGKIAQDALDTAEMVEGVLRQHGEAAMSREEVESLIEDAEALARKGTSLSV